MAKMPMYAKILKGLTHGVNQLRLSSDCSKLITGDTAGTVKLWDVEAESCMDSWHANSETTIKYVDIKRAGHLLTFATQYQSTHIEDSGQKRGIQDTDAFAAPITALDYSFDTDSYIAAYDNGSIHIIGRWQENGLAIIPGYYNVSSVAMSRDCRYVLFTDNHEAMVWKLRWKTVSSGLSLDKAMHGIPPRWYIESFVRMKNGVGKRRRVKYSRDDIALLLQDMLYLGYSRLDKATVQKWVKTCQKEFDERNKRKG